MANFLRHEQCPYCASLGNDSSQDNLAVYDDGSTYCFSCTRSTAVSGASSNKSKQSIDPDATVLPMFTAESVLSKYGISGEAIKRYDIRCINSDDYGLQIEIPLHDVNKQEYTVCRRSVDVADGKLTKDYVFGKGRLKLPLIGWQTITKTTEIIIVCEGITDALAAASQLITSANIAVVGMVGATNANKVAAHFAGYGKRYKLVLAFDNDKAGVEAEEAFVNYLDKHQVELDVSRLPIPKEHKDLRDWIAAGAELSAALVNTQPLVNIGLLDSRQIATKLDEYFQALVDQTYVTLSFSPTLSEAARLTGGMLVGVIGDGGQGKSTFVEHVAMETMQQRQRVLFISQEMQAAEVAIKLLRMVRNEPLEDLRYIKQLTTETRQEIHSQCQRILEYMHTTDSFGVLSTDVIDRHIHKLTSIGQKPAVVVVDHLLAISNDSENSTIMQTCKELKAIAANHSVCIVLLSHVRKQASANKKTLYRPQAADAYGSIGLVAYADVVLAVATDSESKITHVETVKRGRLVGKYADVQLLYADYCYSEAEAVAKDTTEYEAMEDVF